MNLKRTTPRTSVAGALLATLLLSVTGCTSGERGGQGATRSAPPERSVASEPTLRAKPVRMQVKVDRVVGQRLGKERRGRLERQVARVLSGYFDAAYLGGTYPRSDFPRALAAFSPGAARRAASDRHLLTNAGIGPETEAVVARTKRARLDVLVPRRVVAGLTARVRLVFLQQRIDGADQVVTVTGRLLLDRGRSGDWQVFGYDLSRSAVPATRSAKQRDEPSENAAGRAPSRKDKSR